MADLFAENHTPHRVETIGSTSVIPGWDAVSGPA